MAIKTDEQRLETVIKFVDDALDGWKANSLIDAGAVRDLLLDIRQTITREHPLLGTASTDATPTDDQVEVDDVGIVIHTR